jgi:hypothetical protein
MCSVAPLNIHTNTKYKLDLCLAQNADGELKKLPWRQKLCDSHSGCEFVPLLSGSTGQTNGCIDAARSHQKYGQNNAITYVGTSVFIALKMQVCPHVCPLSRERLSVDCRQCTLLRGFVSCKAYPVRHVSTL